MIERLDNFGNKFRYGSIKIRHSIKVDILNSIVCMKNYITTSPGIISPGKVEEKIKVIESLLKVWVTDPKILSEFEELSKDYVSKYIELVPENMDKIEASKEEVGDQLISEKSVIPNHTRRLFKGVNIIKGDVSYLPIGPCCHYCITYKVVNNIAYVIPMTTTPDIFTGFQISKSRFWKGTAIYALYQFPVDFVADKFTMPYDHKGELKDIFKSLEKEFKSILPKERKKRL